jgi:hypothetical protein
VLRRVESYLETLPNGVASYGFCQVKGSIFVRSATTSGLSLPLGDEHVPPEVQALTGHLPSANDWIPEVHYNVLSEAIAELRFAGPGGEAAHAVWYTELNRQLFSSPLYKVMFVVISPDRMYSGAARRWATFHRGSVLTLPRQTKGAATLRLTYPPNLFPDRKLRDFAVSFQVVGEAAGGKNVRVRHVVESEGSSSFEATWT